MSMQTNRLDEYPIAHVQQVAWGDMDAFGHVNNVMYYRYIENARICYFDALNIFSADYLPVVASNQCQYLKPVIYPDVLKVCVRVDEIRRSAIRMHYVLYSEQQQQVVALADAVVVFLNKGAVSKVIIPDQIRKGIIALEHSVKHDIIIPTYND